MNPKLTFSEQDFSMPAWLYQITTNEKAVRYWYPEDYRQEVKEEVPILPWPTGHIYWREQGQVSTGDTVVLFFCKTDNDEPGIYGWGEIIDPPLETGDNITFVTKPPSNFLKNNPCWDDEIDKLLKQIRRRQYQGTLWNIKSNELSKLRKKIRQHITKRG